MKKRGLRFKVFRGIVSREWYFHAIAGNNKITLQSEGYPSAETAHKCVKGVWQAFAYAVCIDPDLSPIPYTKDSLKPKKAATASV